nr:MULTISPECIES: PTS transporter subunit EIIB [Corallincola]
MGGRDNIESFQTCATSRLRLKLKAAVQPDEQALSAAGVTDVMKINDTVFHLLLGELALPCEAEVSLQLGQS